MRSIAEINALCDTSWLEQLKVRVVARDLLGKDVLLKCTCSYTLPDVCKSHHCAVVFACLQPDRSFGFMAE
jgi:uncharacterized Zn finger protein